MERTEYEKWVEWSQGENLLNPPKIVIENYWKWECRASLARFLMRGNQYEPAFRLMQTVVEQEPELDDMLAWALSDLGFLYWKVNEDIDQAASYTKKALDVLDNTQQDRDTLHFFTSGGAYLGNLLELEEKKSGKQGAKTEALIQIERYKEKYPEARKNSYVYEAYKFLANLEEEEGNFISAIDYLCKALDYSSLAQEKNSILKENKLEGKILFKALEKKTRTMLVFDV